MQQTRDLSGRMGEEAIASLLGATIKHVGKGADLRLADGTEVEVKCRLYGQPVNILADQLLSLPDEDIYTLLFYRTTAGIRPIDIILRGQSEDSLYDYFLGQVEISKIFLFPSPHVKEFYRNTHMKEMRISSSGRAHKGLSIQSAERMFDASREEKSILTTPFRTPKSIEVLTYAVGKKMNQLLTGRGY